jgi:hypothetical protein
MLPVSLGVGPPVPGDVTPIAPDAGFVEDPGFSIDDSEDASSPGALETEELSSALLVPGEEVRVGLVIPLGVMKLSEMVLDELKSLLGTPPEGPELETEVVTRSELVTNEPLDT